MRSGCTHENTTVSLVFKDETMTRRCDSCKELIETVFVYAYRERRDRKRHEEGK